MDKNDRERKFILQYVQPGLLGLMDGSVSTLAPLFAAVFATRSSHISFLIGLSASIGAAISMGFAEALSDTGEHTGRGYPVRRGFVTGIMTFVGGVLHTLPFMILNLNHALYLAYVIVGIELIIIAYVRHRYFNMNLVFSMVQVVLGGLLVLVAGVLIGNA